MTSPSKSNDWRVRYLGDSVIVNDQLNNVDEETVQHTMPIQDALDTKAYDHVAIFIGADYCPHCKAFAPTVKQAVQALHDKRCKVLFLSNDRDHEAFLRSCRKNVGIDVLPYDLDKTRAIRDLFDLKTIPALMVLNNSNFHAATPTVVTNARNTLVADPDAAHFPWDNNNDSGSTGWMERFIIRGKYGKWWELGHHANPDFPDQIYMDDHAVRARAGLLNVVTWIAIINVWEWKDTDIVLILFPLVAWEFLSSLVVGLTPVSPFGVVGTIMAIIFHPEPLWKPARPKRFAWAIGLFLSTTCFVAVMLRDHLGDAYFPIVKTAVVMCNLATWFESANGFCFGCFIYNTVLVPMYKLDECDECKL